MHRSRTNLAALLLLAAWATPGFGEERDADDAPQRLAEFQLEELDGDTFKSVQRLRDRGAVITFWRLDQEPSVRILKDLQRLYDEVPKREIAIVSIVAGAVERQQVGSAVKSLEIAFPVLFDPDRRVYAELGAIVSPSTWFVDRSGVLLDAYPGHRRDFLRVARANIEFLRGMIDEAERAERVRSRPTAEKHRDLGAGSIRYRLALRLLEKGRREAAMEQLEEVWQADPPLVEAGVKLGLLLLEEGRDAEALKVLERAVELAPADPLALGGQGVSLIRLGQEQEGTNLLRHALEQPVGEPLLYYEMARSRERANAPDEALRYYRQGLELVLTRRAAGGGD